VIIQVAALFCCYFYPTQRTPRSWGLCEMRIPAVTLGIVKTWIKDISSLTRALHIQKPFSYSATIVKRLKLTKKCFFIHLRRSLDGPSQGHAKLLLCQIPSDIDRIRSVVVISKYLVLVIPANIDRIRSLDLLLFLPRSAFLLSDPGLGWSLGP